MIESTSADTSRSAGGVQAVHVTTRDVDECEAFLRSAGWKVDHNQLSPGPYAVAIAGIVAPRAQGLLHRHARSFAGRGHAPHAAYTFGLQLAGRGAMAVNHRMMRPHEIAAQLPGEEMEFKLPADVTLLTMTLAAERADRMADAMFGRPLARLLRADNALPCNASTGAALAALVSALAGGQVPPGAAERLEETLVDATFAVLQPPEPIRGWSACRRIVRRAVELIDDDEPPATVAALCVALAVPLRTLEDAFHRCLGVAPRTYLFAMRLNRVRRRLANPGDGASVTDAATRFGFFHLGRFAAQYRRLFGERPSETLARARGG